MLVGCTVKITPDRHDKLTIDCRNVTVPVNSELDVDDFCLIYTDGEYNVRVEGLDTSKPGYTSATFYVNDTNGNILIQDIPITVTERDE